MSKQRQKDSGEISVRKRILEAAFAAFTKTGYAATSTAEIAAHARVSKREIYALIGNKQELLIACISERARRLQVPIDLPVPRDRESLARVLIVLRRAAYTRDKRSDGHCGIPAGDRRGCAGARSGAGARYHRARGEPGGLGQYHGPGAGSRTSQGPRGRMCRTVQRAALGKFDDQPAARRRQAAESARHRGPRQEASAAFLRLHPRP